jgi:hypothetical protein
MAVGLPLKTTYANGDVYSASDVNDTNGTINANVNPYVAGKNRVINGAMAINQRNYSSSTTDGSYIVDRIIGYGSGTTVTSSVQAFTAGAAPVAGYEAVNFCRLAVAGQSATSAYGILTTRIEDARTFAGSTATISFWAKANSGTPKIAVEWATYFGPTGSAGVNTYAGQVTLSTSWARYSVTVAIPSISGKTINASNVTYAQLNLWVSAGSDYNSRTGSLGIQNSTFDIWGLQAEQGSTATAFQTATGTIQGELAAAQRYYYRAGTNDSAIYAALSNAAFAQSSTTVIGAVALPVQMRIAPSSIDYSAVGYRQTSGAIIGVTSVTLDTSQTSATVGNVYGTVSSTTASLPGFLAKNNNAAGYLGFSAEL